MSYQFVGNVDQALVRLLEAKANQRGGPSKSPALVFDGGGDIDTAVTRGALDGGSTIAIVNARAGQLSGLAPGTGVDVPADLALFAVKRVPIEGRPGRTHTIVTMVPKPHTARVSGSRGNETGELETSGSPLAFETDTQMVADELERHVTADISLDQTLFPPLGAKFSLLTYVCPASTPVPQNDWPEGSGATQTLSTRTALTFYIYFANGTATPQYYILMVQDGIVSPASGPLCVNNVNIRAYINGAFYLAVEVLQGPATLLTASPAGTTTSPVQDQISQPMVVVALGDGGMQPTPFLAAVENNIPNPDWGVTPVTGTNANTAAWTYYNITGWNALTQALGDFGQWYKQMYDGDDHVIALDNTCQSSTSWETLACWQVPANLNNASPLTVQLQFYMSVTLVGFASPEGSGVGHHQWASPPPAAWAFPQPVWDLVAITGSGAGASALPRPVPTEAKV